MAPPTKTGINYLAPPKTSCFYFMAPPLKPLTKIRTDETQIQQHIDLPAVATCINLFHIYTYFRIEPVHKVVESWTLIKSQIKTIIS